jgi:small subunit ribosomal protein S8
MTNDPISDMLARIRNAMMVHHKQVLMPSSKMLVGIARILKDEGFILNYEVTKDKPQSQLRIILKYDQKRKPVITGMTRVSKPGRRVYTKRQAIPWVLSGMGVAIISTPRGLMTGRKARKTGVGGEVVCYIW